MLAGILLAALFAAGILIVQERRVTQSLQSDTLLDGIADRNDDQTGALLRRGVDVNARERKTGITALMLAAEIGTPDTVEMLLSRGADVNARSHAGHTALLMAVPRRCSATSCCGPTGVCGPLCSDVSPALQPLSSTTSTRSTNVRTLGGAK